MKQILSLTPLILVILLLSNQCWSADPGIGGQLYLGNCAKCHGREGEGFLKLYPPIQNSRFLKEDVSLFPCITRYGLKGTIIVEGHTFNQIMPAIQQLKPEQIGEIIRFLQNKWNHPATELTVDKWLTECSPE